MGAASGIFIADNCMIASDAYITDADWHDIYNRASIGKSAPVHIDENVWIGDRATICKGVHIGKNSIIGASAVVTKEEIRRGLSKCLIRMKKSPPVPNGWQIRQNCPMNLI